jgi:cyclic-di-AMP phosphodiesterase PgpH
MSKRLPEMASPLTKVRKKISRFMGRTFENFTSRQRFWAGFAALCIVTTLLINNPIWRAASEPYKEGDIARESIISPADIAVTDDAQTENNIQEVRESVLPIFKREANRADQSVQNFRSVWENLQRKFDNANANSSSNARANSNANVNLTSTAGSELGKVFGARRFSQNEINAVTDALRDSADGLIYDDRDRPFLQGSITLIDRQKPTQQSVDSMPESNMIALSRARERFRERLLNIRTFSAGEVEAFHAALSPLIEPSVIFDSVATEAARNEAARGVQPTTISLKRGQTVAREGDTITQHALSQIAAIRSYSQSSRQVNRFFGLLAIISALFWVAWKFIEHNQVGTRLTLSEEKTFALFGVVIVIQTALMAICFRLAEFTAAQNLKAPLNDPSIWSFAIPFAAGSLLITLLADRRTALFTGLFLALIAGMLAPKSLEFALFAAIASAVAVYGIGRYRSRQSVTIAGVLVGMASAGASVALIGYTQQPFILNTILLAIACGLMNGLITAAVTAVLLPLCESMFGILTDVKLLELSNADLPVLGQLALRAPGTNQHSHAVGQLAEEACRAVGANGLLARIGALYHRHRQIGRARAFRRKPNGQKSARQAEAGPKREDHHQPRHLRHQARQGDRPAAAHHRFYPAASRHTHAPLFSAQGAGGGAQRRGSLGKRVSLSRPETAI